VQLIDEIADLIRQGVLATSPGTKYPLDQIRAAVTEAESVAHNGKVFLASGPTHYAAQLKKNRAHNPTEGILGVR
jgi:hypothetical protein